MCIQQRFGSPKGTVNNWIWRRILEPDRQDLDAEIRIRQNYKDPSGSKPATMTRNRERRTWHAGSEARSGSGMDPQHWFILTFQCSSKKKDKKNKRLLSFKFVCVLRGWSNLLLIAQANQIEVNLVEMALYLLSQLLHGISYHSLHATESFTKFSKRWRCI